MPAVENTLAYIFRRLLWVPPTLFVVSFVTFSIARLGPGDPIRIQAGQFRDEEAFARIRAAKGLDKPLHEQYVIYMEGVLTRGDLGESFRYQNYDVSEIIFPAIWRSMQYNVVAMVITLSLGLPLGVFAALRQGTWADPTSISIFLFLTSIPSLISVYVLMYVFALKLGWFPARGWPQDCVVQLQFLPEQYRCIGVISREAIIPVMTFAIGGVAGWARFTRAFTLDVLKEDYVRTARSKGLPSRVVMTRHVLRNALLPLSTMLGFALIGIYEGSFFVETITGIPGYGRLTIEAVGGRDYDMIMAVTLIGASTFVIAMIFIDIIYTLIDPRIR
jgi:ABC-type dipeptide/oligopeptide/nickel transport system permease component